MKNKSLIFILAVFATLLFSSCEKDPVKETRSLLVGKDWVEANVGDKHLTVLRFNDDETYIVITLTKCSSDDFCTDRIFNYEGVQYYVEDVSFGQKWLLETATSLKLFSDKDDYITYNIDVITKEAMTLTIFDSFSQSYVNYGNKVSKLVRFKSMQE